MRCQVRYTAEGNWRRLLHACELMECKCAAADAATRDGKSCSWKGYDRELLLVRINRRRINRRRRINTNLSLSADDRACSGQASFFNTNLSLFC